MLLLLSAILGACASSSDSADSAEDTGLQPGDVRVGEFCPLPTRIGQVALWRQDQEAYLDGQVFDTPNASFGEPALTTSTCEFHQFDPSVCGPCGEQEVCAQSGACVAVPRAYTDLEVDVDNGEGTQTFTGDAERGAVFGSAGPVDGSYALTVRFDGNVIEVPAQELAGGDLQVDIHLAGDEMAPGALDATWTPGAEGTFLRTTIPINHHAAGPTFTTCRADASTGAFHADAEMIDPLAVVTGLEFQGLDHAVVVAAQVEAGCLELFYGGHAPFTLQTGG